MNERDLDNYIDALSITSQEWLESPNEAVLNFTKDILHVIPEEYRAWLIKAAINYVKGIDVCEDNEFKK